MTFKIQRSLWENHHQLVFGSVQMEHKGHTLKVLLDYDGASCSTALVCGTAGQVTEDVDSSHQ